MRSFPHGTLWILLAAGGMLGPRAPGLPTARAAVVVLANQTTEAVSFSVQPGQASGQELTLPAGRSTAVPVAGRAQIALGPGGRVPVDPDSLYCIVREGGNLALKRTIFAEDGRGPETPAAALGKLPPPVVVSVKILVDEEQPAVRQVWEQDLRRQIEAASRVLEQHCRVRLKVVAVDTWASGNDLKSFAQLSEEFRRQVDPAPARLAIGFTSQYRVLGPATAPRAAVPPLSSHLLAPAVQKRFLHDDQLILLVRELGAVLGAVPVADDDSVMGRKPPQGVGELRERGLRFDPVNTLVMSLMAEEIRAGDPRTLDEVSEGTRKRLRAIYTRMAEERSIDAARHLRLLAAADRRRNLALARDARPRPPAVARRVRPAEPRRSPAPAMLAGRDRYTGMWADGTQRSGDTVRPWGETSSMPLLARLPLFDQRCPIRWLVDNTIPRPEPPEAMVEMIGGDVLPGRAVELRSGIESETVRLGPYFVVLPRVALAPPDGPAPQKLRVPLRWVRRVVWQRMTDRYQPGTLIYRDGRRVAFRSLRPAEGGLLVLLADGVRQVPLEELAELHLPRSDPWDSYFDELAVLAPDGLARLVQWETEDGLRVTASAERFQARSRGSSDNPDHWCHMVQPAWCLDSLWIRYRRIRLRCYFMPQEVSLSRIEPAAERQQSDLGGVWPRRLDHNAEGGPLAGGDRQYHWGLGVHALSELEFPLPACARSLRTRLGLDTLAGDGGCVLASIFLGPTSGKPLYASPLVIGSTNVLDTGPLRLDVSPGGVGPLVLRVDPADRQRPRGADPLDIRDHFDWLEPILELDPQGLRAEIARRAPGLVPAWRDWTVETGELKGPLLVSYWDQSQGPRGGAYRLLVNARGASLTLSRKLWVSPQADRLMLAVTRPHDAAPSKIEVQVDGRPAGQFDVPRLRWGSGPQPVEISLADYHQRQVTVQIRQRSEGDRSLVQWWSIALAGTAKTE